MVARVLSHTMRANPAASVFLSAGTESHGREVSIWQMIHMTTPLMSRRFGVEIEFLSTVSTDQVMNCLRASGLPVEYEAYTHRVTPHWKVVSDGSCGYELVSPVLEGEAGLDEVRTAAAALEAAGAEVNRKCGFHVHFDASRMSLKAIKNLFKLWLKFEDVLDSLQPPSRRGNANTYCQTNLPYEPFGALYPCRYRKLNIHSYFRHRTLEVRHHSGTTNPEKITNWVRLMARLFDAAESAAAVRNRPEDTGLGMSRMKWFFQAVGAKGLTKFYNARAKKLAA